MTLQDERAVRGRLGPDEGDDGRAAVRASGDGNLPEVPGFFLKAARGARCSQIRSAHIFSPAVAEKLPILTRSSMRA
jgi:hypothetical protein